MASLLLLLLSIAMCSADLTTDVQTIEEKLLEPIIEGLSSQCDNVKKLLKETYESYEGTNEPDVNQLTLEYRAPGVTIIFNISTAAEEIPKSAIFDPEGNLFIFIHGFTDNPSKKNFQLIDEALLNQDGLDPANVHLIGHSLGAHIAAFAGKEFANLTGGNVSRITGLDPAGPCFTDVDSDLKLKATDADFVDVIHTNAGVYGLDEAVGQVDYFPNGGSVQPSCNNQSCNHGRAVYYFAESVTNPDAFLAIKCYDYKAFEKSTCENTTSPMGFGSEPGTTGLYYLETSGTSPFGLGEEGLTYN